jgi:hypothetical protein
MAGTMAQKATFDHLEDLVRAGTGAEADCVSQDIVRRIHDFALPSGRREGGNSFHAPACFDCFPHKNA